MSNLIELLATYKSVHLNQKNLKFHFIGIPMIIFALMMALHYVQLDSSALPIPISLAVIFFLGVGIYYFMLSWQLALGMAIVIIPMLYGSWYLTNNPEAPTISLIIFIIGWIFQFVGHHYEKEKPAFIADLKQLFIGPLFLMAEVYFMLGFCKQLEQQITPLAIAKRKQLSS
jgi:uncharacterized membrane protein YGL010W